MASTGPPTNPRNNQKRAPVVQLTHFGGSSTDFSATAITAIAMSRPEASNIQSQSPEWQAEAEVTEAEVAPAARRSRSLGARKSTSNSMKDQPEDEAYDEECNYLDVATIDPNSLGGNKLAPQRSSNAGRAPMLTGVPYLSHASSIGVPSQRQKHYVGAGGLLGGITNPYGFGAVCTAVILFSCLLLAAGFMCATDPEGKTHPFGDIGIFLAVPFLGFGALFFGLTALYATQFYLRYTRGDLPSEEQVHFNKLIKLATNNSQRKGPWGPIWARGARRSANSKT